MHFYLLLTTGAILKSLRLHPMQAKCFGEESSELQFVTTAPFCNGTSVEEFVIRKLPMTVCEETNKVKIKRESRVHYLVDLYIKGGIVGVALLCLCGILCNFRAKVKSLDEVSFSIEFEEYPPSSNLSSSAGEG